MSPVYVPPPQPPPYDSQSSQRDAQLSETSGLPSSWSDASIGLVSDWEDLVSDWEDPHVAPPQPPPELRICIADADEATRILNLPGLEREEMIQRLTGSCLSRLGVVPGQPNVSIQTQTSPVSGLVLIISFLELALLTITKVAVATKDVADSASAWTGFITGLPAAAKVLRRAVGIGHPFAFNLSMLIGLTINYARSMGCGPGIPIDVCSIEPVQYYVLRDTSVRRRRDTFGILTCDELPRPHTLYGFIITRTGELLASGKTVQPAHTLSPSYSLLQNAVVITPELDVNRSKAIATRLPTKLKDVRRSDLRLGVLDRAQGMIYVSSRENSSIEIDEWPLISLLMASAGTSLIS
jgi:hypothetical protein